MRYQNFIRRRMRIRDYWTRFKERGSPWLSLISSWSRRSRSISKTWGSKKRSLSKKRKLRHKSTSNKPNYATCNTNSKSRCNPTNTNKSNATVFLKSSTTQCIQSTNAKGLTTWFCKKRYPPLVNNLRSRTCNWMKCWRRPILMVRRLGR